MIEFDPMKDAENIAKRGLSLELARLLFEGRDARQLERSVGQLRPAAEGESEQ